MNNNKNTNKNSKMSKMKKSNNKKKDNDDDDDIWLKYEKNVQLFYNETYTNIIGSFAINRAEQYYIQCCSVPLPKRQIIQYNNALSLSLSSLVQQSIPAPLIHLPLHVYIIRQKQHQHQQEQEQEQQQSEQFHCSNDINDCSVRLIVNEMNELYWYHQARILFDLQIVDTINIEDCISISDHSLLIEQVYSNTATARIRGSTSRHIWDTILIPSLFQHVYQKNNQLLQNNNSSLSSISSSCAITVILFDFIGNTLQGTCYYGGNGERNNNNYKSSSMKFVDTTSQNKPTTSESHLLPVVQQQQQQHQKEEQHSQKQKQNQRYPIIVMGERSNKKYNTITKRPHTCLAKTLGHELGHALSLQHTRGRFFCRTAGNTNSSSTTTGRGTTTIPMAVSGKPNLMEGGADSNGGGGYYLEDWQICIARHRATELLYKKT